MQIETAIVIIVVIMFSAIIHEVMHGYVADLLGDPTARRAGRLTLNPIPHLDPFGSIILPILFALAPGNFFFGWAKPVPYNPYNLTKAPYWGEALVAGAGPLSNLVIALIFGLVIRSGVFPMANELWSYVVLINVSLMLLNLIPIPPLDGSKLLSAILPGQLHIAYESWRMRMEYNPFVGFGLVLLVLYILGGFYGNVVYTIASAIAGI